jgi:hypothetical protein
MCVETALKVCGKFASAYGEDVLMLGEESRPSSISSSYRASATKVQPHLKVPHSNESLQTNIEELGFRQSQDV